MRIKSAIVVAAAAWFGAAGLAWAQQGPAPPRPVSRDPGRPGAFEVSVSALWLAESSLGSSNANLISNDTRGSDYRLFSASGDFDATVGFEGRAGYHLTRMFAIEGGVTYSRPVLAVTIANDVEAPSGVSMSGETVSQFFLDASFVIYPVPRGAVRPFLEFGAGYLRELHGQAGATSGYVTKETGQVYHLGGGARYFFATRRSGFVKAYGLRFDARYYIRNGGFSFDGVGAKTFAAGAGLVIGM